MVHGKSLRVLIGTETFPPEVNGAAKFSGRLASCLIERGHIVRVVAPSRTRGRGGEYLEEIEGNAVLVYRLPSVKWPGHSWFRFASPLFVSRFCSKIIDDFQPDVIHYQSHFMIGLSLSKKGRARGVRLVGTNHFMPDNVIHYCEFLPTFLHKFLWKANWHYASRCFARADVVTSPTQSAANFLERYTTIENVVPISCGIDLSGYTPSFERGSVLLYVGRITREKQLDVLIRAFAKLNNKDITLKLVGIGEEVEPLRALTYSLGVSDRVVFCGYLEEGDLRKTYSEASVFVMPSTAELQSIATMEAMASGLPVVGADSMALPHLVRDGENGYLFSPGDPDDLASKLTAVIALDDADFAAMQRRSLEIVAEHEIDRTIDAFERLYAGSQVSCN